MPTLSFTTVSLALLALLPSSTQGQDAWRPPSWAAESIRAQVAQVWEASPGEVVLEWGRAPTGRDVIVGPDSTQVAELAGAGTRGEWVARLPTEGGSFGVRVKAGLLQVIPLASRAIERGETLVESDFVWEESVRWGSPGELSSLPKPGWRAERRIDAGEELREPSVRPAVAVRTGESVKVVWKSGRIELTLSG